MKIVDDALAQARNSTVLPDDLTALAKLEEGLIQLRHAALEAVSRPRREVDGFLAEVNAA